jgi:hypothetical protein
MTRKKPATPKRKHKPAARPKKRAWSEFSVRIPIVSGDVQQEEDPSGDRELCNLAHIKVLDLQARNGNRFQSGQWIIKGRIIARRLRQEERVEAEQTLEDCLNRVLACSGEIVEESKSVCWFQISFQPTNAPPPDWRPDTSQPLSEESFRAILAQIKEAIEARLEQEPEEPHQPEAARELARLAALSEWLERIGEATTDKGMRYEEAASRIDEFVHGFHGLAARLFTPILDREIRARVAVFEQENERTGRTVPLTRIQERNLTEQEKETLRRGPNVLQKKELAAWVGEELRTRGMSICRNGVPHRLVVDTDKGYPMVGRFRLVPLGSNHPTTPQRNIFDLLPLVLMEAPARTEGLSQWRDRTTKPQAGTNQVG